MQGTRADGPYGGPGATVPGGGEPLRWRHVQEVPVRPVQRTSGTAIASLVFGLLGAVTGWLPLFLGLGSGLLPGFVLMGLFGLALPLVALGLGLLARQQIVRSNGLLGGQWMAITGMSLGGLFLLERTFRWFLLGGLFAPF